MNELTVLIKGVDASERNPHKFNSGQVNEFWLDGIGSQMTWEPQLKLPASVGRRLIYSPIEGATKQIEIRQEAHHSALFIQVLLTHWKSKIFKIRISYAYKIFI
jgi:hypothetical protein